MNSPRRRSVGTGLPGLIDPTRRAPLTPTNHTSRKDVLSKSRTGTRGPPSTSPRRSRATTTHWNPSVTLSSRDQEGVGLEGLRSPVTSESGPSGFPCPGRTLGKSEVPRRQENLCLSTCWYFSHKGTPTLPRPPGPPGVRSGVHSLFFLRTSFGGLVRPRSVPRVADTCLERREAPLGPPGPSEVDDLKSFSGPVDSPGQSIEYQKKILYSEIFFFF